MERRASAKRPTLLFANVVLRIALAPWPTFDPALTVDDTVEYAVQVNGKVRARITTAASAPEDTIKTEALAAIDTEGRPVKRVIVIKGKLVSIVV